jgi:hypothetical protein
MFHLRQTFLPLALAVVSIGSWAQTDTDHAQHHSKATTAAEASATESAKKSDRKDQMIAMDSKMKAMHEVHDQMLSAKTPDERNALMTRHMNAMRQGMESLNMMGADGMGEMKGEKHFPRNSREREQMMEKRMEMMEMMMQMMMDQMPVPAR